MPMAVEPPNEPEGMSQDDTDAALSAAGDASGGQDPSTQSSEGGVADQPGGGGSSETNDAAEAAVPVGEAQAGESDDASAEGAGEFQGFSQDDIDAALAAAQDDSSAVGDEADASTPEPAGSQASSPDLSTTNPDGTPQLDSQGRPFDEAAVMMEAAIAEESAAADAAKAQSTDGVAAPGGTPVEAALPSPPAGSVPLPLPEFGSDSAASQEAEGISLLNDVRLNVKIELGRAEMLIEDVLKLGSGSVVELDKLAGDPVDVLVNDRLVARGEVLVLNDNFCVRISEIMAGAGGTGMPAA